MSDMKALVATAPNKFQLESIQIPVPGPDDVLVQVHGCTICGSDVKLLCGNMGGVAFPVVPGHEWSGTVVETGRNMRRLINRRVVANILQSCGGCAECTRGRPNLCTSLIEPGLTAQGAFAEFIVVPGRTIHVLPDAVQSDIACLIEPLSVARYAFDRQPARPSDRVLILGGGGIGLLILSILRSEGLEQVVLADPHEARRSLALRLGALATFTSWTELKPRLHEVFGADPDVVYHAASRATAFAEAVAAVRPGGRICIVGYSGHDTVPIAPSDFAVKLLDVRGSLSPTADLNVVTSLIYSGRIDPRPLLTHSLPLERFRDAFYLAQARADGAVRVLVQP
jgi:2-desacetyl-2-hydroxyethyl bacteriochlorophyllide A dehydrogenase